MFGSLTDVHCSFYLTLFPLSHLQTTEPHSSLILKQFYLITFIPKNYDHAKYRKSNAVINRYFSPQGKTIMRSGGNSSNSDHFTC